MIISKIYTGKSGSGNKRSIKNKHSISDPRVITPSSIPIFILPPTLDSYANGNKPDLNDSYDCWSLVDDDNMNNIEYSTKRNSTAGTEVTTRGAGVAATRLSPKSNDRKGAGRGTTSLDNLNKLDIGPKGGNRNSSISSTSSTPNPHYENNTTVELSKKQHQQPQQQQPQACSKSRVKTLFRNGFLNMNTITNENDEIKSKENYCNQWVLSNGDGSAAAKSRSNINLNTNKSSSTNLSVVDAMSKSPSINFDRAGGDDKSEEQMQREWLVNLLIQVQKEQDCEPHRDDDDSKKKSEKGKKNKRSKSETLTTLNSIWTRGNSNVITPSTSKRSNRLDSVEKQTSTKSKTGQFLDVDSGVEGGNEQRRFSLRNLFSKPSGFFSAKSSQSHLNKRNSEPENYLIKLFQTHQRQNENLLTNPPPKIVNSRCSMSNSSSMTSTSANNVTTAAGSASFKMPPVSSVTGSVLKFHRNKLSDKFVDRSSRNATTGEVSSTRTLSDPNMNKIRSEYSNSLRLPNDAENFSHQLSLLDRREMFKCSKSSSSNNLDDENDMDKIFGNYIEKRVANGSTEHPGGYYYRAREASDIGEPSTGTKNNHRRFLSFMFRPSQKQSVSGSRSVRSSFRSKFKLFSNRSRNSKNKQTDHFEMVAPVYNKKASLNSNFKFDLHNLNLNEIDKDFFKYNGTKRGNNSDSIKSSNSIYVDANLVVPSRIKKSRSTLPDLKTELSNMATSFIFRNSANKAVLTAFVDVSIEKLQQTLHGHTLSISLKNFRTEPLIEINHIKAKFCYLSIELVDSKSIDVNSIRSQSPSSSGQMFAKINKIKTRKCKFDHNLKSFSKPIDFELVDEHFLSVTEEATNLQIRKVVMKSSGGQQSLGDTGDEDSARRLSSVENNSAGGDMKKTYLFLFSIEVHSYLPVSRKILISTFRKKKRIFKGQCQIHENFIHSTQFTKHFLLTEL